MLVVDLSIAATGEAAATATSPIATRMKISASSTRSISQNHTASAVRSRGTVRARKSRTICPGLKRRLGACPLSRIGRVPRVFGGVLKSGDRSGKRVASRLEIPELIEAGASRRQKHDIAGLRNARGTSYSRQ